MDSLGINDNNIISGIPNSIPSPSILQYVVKKDREATFMIISGFICNYTYSMSCYKGDSSGLGWMIKDTDLWGVERFKSMRLDSYASKGR